MFKFTKTPDEVNTYDNTTIDMSIESNDTIWTDLLANFIEFLRGCGYQIPELEFSEVDEEEEDTCEEEEEVPVWYKEDCDCGYCVEYRAEEECIGEEISLGYRDDCNCKFCVAFRRQINGN